MQTVVLPWPSRDLSPNARVHWAKKAKAVKQARRDGANAALAAGYRRMNAAALRLAVTFCPPNNHARDDDNMLASLKANLDGISDALGVDDSKFSVRHSRGPVTPLGKVLIDIEVQ